MTPMTPVTSIDMTPQKTLSSGCRLERGLSGGLSGQLAERSALGRAGTAMLGSSSSAPPSTGEVSGVKVRLLIVRHAQSANKQRLPGQKASQDPELTDQGYEQASSLGQRLEREFPPGVLSRSPLAVISSPMRRCLLTIQPTVQRLNLSKDLCMCHGSFYEFGCAGNDRRSSTPSEIIYEFPEFTCPTGFTESGHWDYRGNHPKETEQECRDRCARLADFIHYEAAAALRARSSGTDSPTLFLVIHQSLADLLCQILVEGTSANWTYGEITHKLTNAAMTEVILHPDGRATFGHKNDDRHIGCSKASLFGFKPSRTVHW